MSLIAPLTRDEVVSVIEGRAKTRRVPMEIHLWVHPDTFGDREQAVRDIMRRYPEDLQIVPIVQPAFWDSYPDSPEYRWVPSDMVVHKAGIAHDQQIIVPDWSRLDEIIERFPKPDYPGLFKNAKPADGRYRIGHWWYCFFERHWSLRGMVNALTDYYTNPKEVHRFFRALTDLYKGFLWRMKHEQGCDGILTGDDLGTQTAPFFSPSFFKEYFKPYYTELCSYAHELGMHFWLHSCGNVEAFIPDWIEGGLDVLHPIQKHTMNEQRVSREFGDRLTIFTGLDVQQVIPWGTPQQVRAEVRHLLDTFWKPGKGKCVLTAGNGINQDCTLESLEAFYDEAVTYGAAIAQRR